MTDMIHIWRPGLRASLFALVLRNLNERRSLWKNIPGSLRIFSYFYHRLKPATLIKVSSGGLEFVVDGRDEVMVPFLLATGVHEPRETSLFHEHLKPGMIAVDIGANFGYFSVLAASLVGRAGRVVAFEPENSAHTLLRRNLELNGAAQVRVIKKAVAEKRGEAVLYCDRQNLGAHSLRAENLPLEKGGEQKVETVPLDDALEELKLPRIDFLKIDAQGAEGQILKGAVKTLATPGLKILLEFEPSSLEHMGTDPAHFLSVLRGAGFAMTAVERARLTPNATDAEILSRGRELNSISLFLEKKGTEE